MYVAMYQRVRRQIFTHRVLKAMLSTCLFYHARHVSTLYPRGITEYFLTDNDQRNLACAIRVLTVVVCTLLECVVFAILVVL